MEFVVRKVMSKIIGVRCFRDQRQKPDAQNVQFESNLAKFEYQRDWKGACDTPILKTSASLLTSFIQCFLSGERVN